MSHGVGDPRLDECAKAVFADRDKVAAFYDVRYVFAAYCEVVESLAAAMIKNGIYPKEVIEGLLEEMKKSALTRQSQTTCQFTHGDDVIKGSKQ